jgi:hypothetical protein
VSDEPDRVHTVCEWYDGPRTGAADYGGAKYWYRSLYLDNEKWNPDEDRFELTPLTPEAFNWEIERQAIFRRWDAARQAGTIVWRDGDEESFGAFPDEMARYRALNRSIEAYLADHPARLLVRGSFQPGSREVHWKFIRQTGNAEHRVQ